MSLQMDCKNGAVTGPVQSIPGDRFSCAREALEAMLEREPTRLRVAVAFVTLGGVEILTELLGGWSGKLELVARGAPITQPDALDRLEQSGASVRAVVGRRAMKFHPKLWMSEGPDAVEVLSGSGNLTGGGLSENDEQFELLSLEPAEEKWIAIQRARIETFLTYGVPIAELRGSRYWDRWLEASARSTELEREALELDAELAQIAGTPAESAQLYADLVAIYEAAKTQVTITYDDGSERPYVANRFKQAIDRGRREGTLVPVVSRIVDGPTDGFGRLAEAGRRDLMVETLVVDSKKAYHRLFVGKTKELAQANLDLYDREYGGQGR
jgi:HKD family nuclease